MRTQIAIIGLWHQGIVAAGCLADLGYEVCACDLDELKVSSLSLGHSPIYEPELDELLKRGISNGNLSFTSNPAEAVKGKEFVFLMFDTPVDENDISDLTCIFNIVEIIAPHLRKDSLIWNTSQVPVGTSEQIVNTLKKINPILEVDIVYSPENLRLGKAIELFFKPALPVIGSENSKALERMEVLLKPLNVSWMRVGLRTAEFCKHALNSFLATTISFANELGNLCEQVGADGLDVAKALRLEPRIGSKAMLRPGMGFSGGTLARDVQTLRSIGDLHSIETYLLDGLWKTNSYQNQFVIRKLVQEFGDINGKVISILGITYKPGTSTLRRSVALATIESLNKLGATVRAHDPKADKNELRECSGFTYIENILEVVEGADALAVITGWEDYQSIDWKEVKALVNNPLIIDCNNMFDHNYLTSKGFKYFGIGRCLLSNT